MRIIWIVSLFLFFICSIGAVEDYAEVYNEPKSMREFSLFPLPFWLPLEITQPFWYECFYGVYVNIEDIKLGNAGYLHFEGYFAHVISDEILTDQLGMEHINFDIVEYLIKNEIYTITKYEFITGYSLFIEYIYYRSRLLNDFPQYQSLYDIDTHKINTGIEIDLRDNDMFPTEGFFTQLGIKSQFYPDFYFDNLEYDFRFYLPTFLNQVLGFKLGGQLGFRNFQPNNSPEIELRGYEPVSSNSNIITSLEYRILFPFYPSFNFFKMNLKLIPGLSFYNDLGLLFVNDRAFDLSEHFLYSGGVAVLVGIVFNNEFQTVLSADISVSGLSFKDKSYIKVSPGFEIRF